MPDDDRLALVKIALRNEPKMIASDIEFQLPKPSYMSRSIPRRVVPISCVCTVHIPMVLTILSKAMNCTVNVEEGFVYMPSNSLFVIPVQVSA